MTASMLRVPLNKRDFYENHDARPHLPDIVRGAKWL